jgi:hypothetical protein
MLRERWGKGGKRNRGEVEEEERERDREGEMGRKGEDSNCTEGESLSVLFYEN